MDYEKFVKEYDTYINWEEANKNDGIFGAASSDTISFGKPNLFAVADGYSVSEAEREHPFVVFGDKDEVNSPAHYTRGKTEAIDVIEEAIQDAPDPKAGFLQAQVLKYMLRLWLKQNDTQDAEKAQWYLNRLVEHLSQR